MTFRSSSFLGKKGNFAPLTNWLVRRLDVDDGAIGASRIPHLF